MRLTLTPAASAASGFSPTARRRSPKGVSYTTYQTKETRITRAIAITTGDCGNKWSLGSWGVEPDERKSAPLKNPGIPSIRILIAAPLTTWLALYLIQATAYIAAMNKLAPIAANKPIQGLAFPIPSLTSAA